MAQLNFTKQSNGRWGAEATAYEDFVIQLDRVEAGRVIISASQDVSMGKDIFFVENRGKNFRQSFDDMIYPLYLLIESESEVTSGIILEKQ